MKRILICVCALFMFGATNAATLNFQYNGTTKQIELDTTKRTAPALAMRIGNKTMYATMARTTTQQSGELYVKYNSQIYHVLETSPESKFTITTTPTTNNFDFIMSAAGTFYVDWGDGVIDEIVSTDTTPTQYSHNYATAGEYNIGFGGRATEYHILNLDSDEDGMPTIAFIEDTRIAKIDGSLGAIFPTIGDGTTPGSQPMFFYTFYGCTELTEIPEKLFSGVSGAADGMFAGTFEGCTGLTSIPAGLFSGVSGAADYMFNSTFSGCTGLTEIPGSLFSGVSGAGRYMFYGTFYGCTGLTRLPDGLFSGVSGAADYMFGDTFEGCTGLTKIPANLFSGVSGAAYAMFANTFQNCTELTEIPEELFSGVSGAGRYMFYGTFYGCTGLTRLPDGLFSGVSGSAYCMFASTFEDCTGLTGTIPLGFFGNPYPSDTLADSDSMFYNTFRDCTNLTGLTARNADGTELYDIVNPETDETWWNEMPSAFSDMYYNTGITGVR